MKKHRTHFKSLDKLKPCILVVYATIVRVCVTIIIKIKKKKKDEIMTEKKNDETVYLVLFIHKYLIFFLLGKQ